MNILILTTDTYHHLFFVKQIKKRYKNLSVILEKKKNKFNFKTYHQIAYKINKFEKKFFFKNKKEFFDKSKKYNDINDLKCIKYIKRLKPNVIISFGIGLIKPKFLNNFKNSQIVNLHGGDLNRYRGLDSHMWSIYHNDFKSLITTLHFVKRKIDSGNIIFKKKIVINNKTKFESLRALNTVNCVKLVLKYLILLKKNKYIKNKKLNLLGRYYSAIPNVLIDRCIKNFKKNKKKI